MLNRSGLWCHMLETCRSLRRLCCKHWNNVARHDKAPVKSTLWNILSRDMIKLQLSQHFEIFCRATWVWYVIKHFIFHETAWSILFWSHKNDVTNLVKVHKEYSPAARILHTKFDQACDVIFMVSKQCRSGCFTESVRIDFVTSQMKT